MSFADLLLLSENIPLGESSDDLVMIEGFVVKLRNQSKKLIFYDIVEDIENGGELNGR